MEGAGAGEGGGGGVVENCDFIGDEEEGSDDLRLSTFSRKE